VHLAKNNEEDVDPNINSINSIDAHSVANQWISAHKMCPGSFSVMG